MKNLYIIIITFFVLNVVKAQTPTYTTSNSGLLSNNVSSIAIDAQGNKWFANFEQGVSKFDDTTWTTYTTSSSGLISQFVHTLAIDALGNKWIGTWDGLSKFDGTTWTDYTTGNGMGCNDVLSIAFDAQGNKWIGASGGVSKFNDTTWTNYTIFNSGLADSSVTAIAFDTLGNKWFATPKGISKFDGVNWTNYLSNRGFLSIAVDAQNNVWAGTGITNSGFLPGIYKFDGTNWTNYTFNLSTDTSVKAIAIDGQDNKWFAGEFGVAMFDGTNWTDYISNYPNSGLVGYNFKAIAFDNQANKWFGSNEGVSVLSVCGFPQVENICYVEFDSASIKNRINWPSNLPANIDSMRVYNEVSTGVWSLIGSVPSSHNYYIDSTSNPFNQSYSYKIATVDTCGNESDYSSHHTTITLLAAYDQGSNAYGFTWSAYQGLSVANYNLYGIMANGNVSLIGTVPGNQFFYNYTNPFAGFVHYFIGFNTPSCSSKTDHLVKSNWVQSVTGINDLVDNENLFSLYPNPAKDKLFINSSAGVVSINIYNTLGMFIKEQKSNFENGIDVSSLSKGVYYIMLKTEKSVSVKKIILQ